MLRFSTLLLAATLCSQLSAQANDECTGATLIVDGLNGPFDNTLATNSVTMTGAPTFPCGGTSTAARDLWFVYLPTCTGDATFQTCGNATFDTRIQAFDGSCGALVSLGCNDDACSLQSSITVPVTFGIPILVRVAGYSSGVGTFSIDASCSASPLVVNDDCASALPLVDGPNGLFSNAGATSSGPGVPCSTEADNDVWFSYVPTCDGEVTFDTCSPNRTVDTAIEAFYGRCGSLIPAACNDDSCGLGSSVTIQCGVGSTVLLRVAGWRRDQGDFDVNVTCVATTPANDECAGAIEVFNGVNGTFTNFAATNSPEGIPCTPAGADVWFTYTATCTGRVEATLCSDNSSFDTAIVVSSGACGALVTEDCNDDNFACSSGGLLSRAVWAATAGTTYYIQVGGFAGATGTFDLSICCGEATSTAYGRVPGHPNFGQADLVPVSDFQLGTNAQLTLNYDNQLGDIGGLLLGLAPTSFPFLGGELLVDQVINSRPFGGAPSTSEDFIWAVPLDPALCSPQGLYFQAVLFDSDTINPTPFGIVFSNGVEVFVGH